MLMMVHRWDEEEKIFKEIGSLFIPQLKLERDEEKRFIIDLGLINVSS